MLPNVYVTQNEHFKHLGKLFRGEISSLSEQPLIVLRKPQRGPTPDVIPSLPHELINSADEIGSGGRSNAGDLIPCSNSGLNQQFDSWGSGNLIGD